MAEKRGKCFPKPNLTYPCCLFCLNNIPNPHNIQIHITETAPKFGIFTQ